MALSPAQRARHDLIARLYVKDRLSCYQIAERVLMNPTGVARVIKARGLTRPAGWHCKPIAANKPRNELIKRLYTKDRLTTAKISERIPELSPSGVAAVLKSMGVPRRKTGSWVPPRPAEYYEVRAFAERIAPEIGRTPGATAVHFARIIGVTPERLRKHLRELGTPKRLARFSVIDLGQATRLKAMLVTGKYTYQQLADRFGIGQSTVWAIARGRSWADAPWPHGKPYKIGNRAEWRARILAKRWPRKRAKARGRRA